MTPDISPTPGEFRQCFSCNYEEIGSSNACPQCRSTKFFTRSSIRRRGIVLSVIGIFLAGFIGAVAVGVGMLLLGSKDPETIRKVNSEIYIFLIIYLLFGAVFLFGIHSIVSGLWMAIAGKRNRVLLWVMWVLLFAVMIVGGIAGMLSAG
jgi:Protein of unknown function (DUF3681)